MNRRLLVVALLFVALIFLQMSIVQMDGFVGGGSSGEEVKVVIAKADWCGHCRKAAPEFEKLQKASPIRLTNGGQAVVEILDADQNKAEMAAYSVKGFPTILIIKGSAKTEYPGERTYDAVVNFLNEMK